MESSSAGPGASRAAAAESLIRGVDWPIWSPRAGGAALARYVVPDVVVRHAAVPGPSDRPMLDRLSTLWERLRSVGIDYAHERAGSGPHGQWIRPPSEVLVAPRNGTCLDLAVLLAGACLHAGLRAGVVVTDARAPGRPGHALTVVLVGDCWPGGDPVDDVWAQPPPGFLDAVQQGLESAPRAVLALDPNGIARSLAGPVAGTDCELDVAVRRGHDHLASGRWRWRVGVVARRRDDAYVPAPVPRVLPLRDLHRPADGARSALQLLRAEYRLTPFLPRDELPVLSTFCDDVARGARTGVVVVTGRGGSGKTRLALELGRRLQEDGWCAGVLREHTPTGETLEWLATVTGPLLIVIDYADARAAAAVDVLRVVARREVPAVVLLAARERQGEWLTQITDALESDAHPYQLEELDLPEAHPRPRDVFTQTFRALRTLPDRRPPQVPVPERGTRWTTLDLVLLGWLAASGHGPLPATPGALYEEVLRHERRYWNTTFHERTGTPMRFTDLLGQAAACLTLLTPSPTAVDRVLTAVDGLADPGLRAQVADTLVTCLDPGPGEHLAIRPDPVGDHHLLTTLDRRPQLLERCLRVGADRAEQDLGDGTVNALTVLSRAARSDGAEASAAVHVEALLRTEPGRWPLAAGVARALGGVVRGVLEDLASAPDTPLPLDDMAAGLPFEAAGLWRLGLLVDERRLEQVRAASSGPERTARMLLAVSHRRADAGDRAGAREAAEEAVVGYRGLAEEDRDAFTSYLAMALNTLSNARADTCDRAGAVTAAEEAVAVHRQLADHDPDTFTPRLAAAVSTLSNRYAEAGERARATQAVEEAVRLRRRLAEADPEAYLAELAGVLNNLSNRRAEAGELAAALDAVDEAVALYRALADEDATGRTADLATALSNQSNWRAATGDLAGALASIDEAFRLRQRLVEVNPGAFTPDLAAALNNLANCRAGAGDRPGALAAIEEAVQLRRRLADGDPDAFTADLAESLNNASNWRADAGDPAGARAAVEEAVRLYRSLADRDPSAFARGLATSLNNLANCRSRTGDLAGALVAAQEAVRVARSMAAHDAAAFTADLALALDTLSTCSSAVGDHRGALAASREAVALHRTAARPSAGAVTPHLAGAIGNLSRHLAGTGDHLGALAAIEEAVALYRRLAETRPSAHRPDLARELTAWSVQLAAVGDREGALRTTEEAVALLSRLADTEPAAFTPDLATSVNNLANRRWQSGDRAGALVAIDEAVALWRGLADGDPAAYAPGLAMALNNLAVQRSHAGDGSGALAAMEEAARRYRDLADTHPGAFTRDLAMALNNLSGQRAAAGDAAGALAAAEEAVALRRRLVLEDPAVVTPELAAALNNLSNRRAETADPAGALAAIEEAVALYRGPAVSDPAAFAPKLAMALQNLSSCRARVGDRSGVRAAREEATDLYRRLGADDPIAFVPDLAGATRELADHVATESPDDATAVWEASVSSVPARVCRGELRAAAAAWYAGQQRTADAAAEIVEAAEDVQADPLERSGTGTDGWSARRRPVPAFAVTRARRRVREAALSLPSAPGQLPGWATRRLPAPDAELIRAWCAASSWPGRARALRTAPAVVTGDTLAGSIDVMRALHPEADLLPGLAEVAALACEQGLEPVLAELDARYDARQLVHSWTAAGDGEGFVAYLTENLERLGDVRVTELLAGSDDPVHRRQAAVLALVDRLPLATVRELATNPAAAADTACGAVERADLEQLRLVVQANRRLSDEPSRGMLLLAVLALGGGRLDLAEALASEAMRTSTPLQRRARLALLRRFAAAADADLSVGARSLIAMFEDDPGQGEPR